MWKPDNWSLPIPGSGAKVRTMSFQINAGLHYDVISRSTVLLSINAITSGNQILHKEALNITPGIHWEEIPSEPGGNRYIRLDTGDSPRLDVTYAAEASTRVTRFRHSEIDTVSIADLRSSAIPYLFPSRYCQSDRLGRLAVKLFGGYDGRFNQVVAITDWIFENIDYLSGATDPATSAFDTITQRAGVCRDFAHIGIAFCRALSIPARYLTCYACNMQPPDFHACFEACIGNRWFVFDPTRLASLNGLVRIATGRDAADAAIATIFGQMTLTEMTVSCVSNDFQPLGPQDLADHAILIQP